MIHVAGRDWYTANEIPDMWPDVTPEAVRAWASRGRLNGHRIGREVYYDINDLAKAEHQASTATRGNKRGAGRTGADVVTC